MRSKLRRRSLARGRKGSGDERKGTRTHDVAPTRHVSEPAMQTEKRNARTLRSREAGSDSEFELSI